MWCLLIYGRGMLDTAGSFPSLSMTLFMVGMGLITYRFGFGMKQNQRSVMSLGMGTRNIAAVLAAALAIPNADPRIVVMVVMWTLWSVVLAAIAANIFARQAVDRPCGRCGMTIRAARQIRWPRPFAGLKGVTLADVPREVSAGITLAALMIPLNIGYAQVAGLPPVAGLYAAIIPLVVFALLASSRHLVTSPDASMATLVGAALVAFAAPGDPLRLQYALALAVVCGLLFLVFWIFRLAFLANFLSRAVMAGFITGLGIEVFTNQVRKILAAPHVADAGVGRAGGGGAAQGDHGELGRDRGLLRRGHRPRPVHPPRQPVLGGDRASAPS